MKPGNLEAWKPGWDAKRSRLKWLILMLVRPRPLSSLLPRRASLLYIIIPVPSARLPSLLPRCSSISANRVSKCHMLPFVSQTPHMPVSCVRGKQRRGCDSLAPVWNSRVPASQPASQTSSQLHRRRRGASSSCRGQGLASCRHCHCRCHCYRTLRVPVTSRLLIRQLIRLDRLISLTHSIHLAHAPLHSPHTRLTTFQTSSPPT